MIETKRCPRCGGAVPADAPAGMCPQCLLKGAFETTVGVEESQPVRPSAGQRFGDYTIVRRLGEGGMGAVYEAEHTESGRLVALKVLNHTLQSPEHRQRFLREGRLAASVNHPNTVYVYGTEEIDGTPVISMELASGGTLQDRVRREGPLPVGEAVDVILDAIAGLEAALDAGVLHRDVKPANCFVDAGGAVKVGDFGLSIATALRADTNLTQSGVFLGTPAFSSPEQLRGDELDVRSDIYSVGVTLFYLLTGETPFQAKHMVQLLATVLERPAPSPRDLRREIPPPLAGVVLRCLAKQNTGRFASYAELRRALLPWASSAPTPGTLGFRFLASGVDFVVLGALAAFLPLVWLRDFRTWQQQFWALWDPGPQSTAGLMALSGLGILLHLAYFTILEGIWGAAAGKAICRLRVVRRDRAAPGLARAALRAAIFCASAWLPWWVLYAFDPDSGIAAHAGDDPILLALSVTTGLLVFCTVRRRNGYAGVHDLASGTRVIRTRTDESRPALPPDDEPLPEMEIERRVGPYAVLGRLDDRSPELLLGYDPRLLRRVWIRWCLAGTAPVPSPLRALARIGRLRWLGGERNEEGGWDAYEARRGQPLLGLIDVPQPWSRVRFWLADLAEELSAGLEDGTLPSRLELERVWITAAGRAVLLDFPAPGLERERRAGSAESVGSVGSAEPAPRGAGSDTAGNARAFIRRVAVAALEGGVPSPGDSRGRAVAVPLPLPARSVLAELDGAPHTGIPTRQLLELTRRPACVSIGRRIGSLAACWILPILLSAQVMTLFYAERQFLRSRPEVGELAGFVEYYRALGVDSGPDDAELYRELRQAIEVLVAARFRATITDARLWADPLAVEFVDSDGVSLLRGFVRDHPDPAPEEVAAAATRLELVLPHIRSLGWSPGDFGLSTPSDFLAGVAGLLVVLVVLPSLVSALLFRGTLLLRMLEIAIVTGSGAPASRLRVVSRNAILWSLTLAALAVLIALLELGRLRLISLLMVYGVVTMFTAERGLHDRLAGTWMVPRQ